MSIDILCVDDDEKLCEFMAKNIRAVFSQVYVMTAYKNQDAWNKLTTGTCDVILYDLGNDTDETYPFVHKIHELNPDTLILGVSLADPIMHRPFNPVFADVLHSDKFYLTHPGTSPRDLYVFESALKTKGIMLQRNQLTPAP